MELVYFTITFFALVYLLNKFHDFVCSLIILTFFAGLPDYLGKSIENPYKIIMFALSIYILIKINPFKNIGKKERAIIVLFVALNIAFMTSIFMNDTYLSLSLSQYAKIFVPFAMFFTLRHFQMTDKLKFDKIRVLFLYLLGAQVLLSFLKLLILGIRESTVGSISYFGGGAATTIPVLGFIFLWLSRKGVFSRKDWVSVLLLLFIGFMSVKRAIWFVTPMVIFLFMFYVPRKKLPKKYLLVVLILPLIFYLGIRLNPSLNPEEQVWGSFDLDYAIKYASKYSFGEKETGFAEEKTNSEGRGGATLLLFKKLANLTELQPNDIYGYGLQEFYAKDYEEFDKEKFAINHRGSVTGIFSHYITIGYLGTILFLLYILGILSYIREKRIKYSIIIFILWDYLFYSGLVTQTQGLFILLIFLVHYANLQRDKNIKERAVLLGSRSFTPQHL